jgi:glycerol-3-phosphate acyltransferase PlsY
MFDPPNWTLPWSALAGALAVGYLFGSIPFGLILTRFAGTPDLRSIGSGNIGATNVLRTGRKELAVATLVGDALKGTAAVFVAYSVWGDDGALLAGLGAFLGHLFPVWLRFKGGKGVAVYIGLLIAFAWPIAGAFCVVWLAVAALTRYSSLSALVASLATPPLLLWTSDVRIARLFLLLTVLLWVMHRANLARLINGSEGKIGQKSTAAEIE